MLKLLPRIKKLSVFTAAFLAFNTNAFSQAAVEGDVYRCIPEGTTLTERYLSCIQQHTNHILTSVNKLPDYITAASAYFLAWMETDEPKKSVIPEMIPNFTALTNNFTAINDIQEAKNQEGKELQKQIVTDMFKNPSDIKLLKTVTSEQMPNANDLVYQILLGIPKFDPDPRKTEINSPLNYTKIASGLNILHPIPGPDWQGSVEQQRRYNNYYYTMTAVQTYNAYLMSQLYAEYKNEAKDKQEGKETPQTALIKQASSADWLTQAGSENIGLVLRHILIFDSQIYVLLTRMLEVQKQMLTAQAMNNSLLMVLNLGNEDMLVKKASGEIKP